MTNVTAETLASLTAATGSDAYQQIVQAMTDLRGAVLLDQRLFAHVDGLFQIMPRLRDIVAQINAEEEAKAAASEASA